MKNVLLITSKVPHYRVSVYNYLWRRFQENGWEFKVVSNRLQPQSQLPVKFTYRELPFTFSNYRGICNEWRPDVVIFHLLLKDKIFWYLAHWFKMRGTPFICWTKGANLDRPDSKIRYHLFNYLHTLSGALLLYSPNEIKHIKPSCRSKVFVANNTVNYEEYPEVKETKEQIRAEFGITFKKVVLFVGTMGIDGERKKVKHLIEVFRKIDRSDVGVLLVGAGLSDELKAQMNPKNTRYLGEVHDPTNMKISKLFKAADLFVVPGHVGLGLNQAFYWGLPAVTERGYQPPEIQYLKSGRNGFMVGMDDLAELQEKMLLLLDNDTLREEFSRNAMTDIRKDASIENMFESFLKAVQFVHAPGDVANKQPQTATAG
jgi:glycosyltransferase involved in cell wall biosynthesis